MNSINDFEIKDGALIKYKGKDEYVEVPTGVTSVESFAFKGCDTARSIKLPKSLKKIEPFALSDCDSIEELQVENGCYEFYSEGNCIIKTGRKVVALGCKNSVIPPNDEIVGIGKYAFANCRALEKIEIPNTVCYLGESAFYNCHRLESIVIPDSVNCIEEGAFRECYSLESIVIPSSVALISRDVFDGCDEGLVIKAERDSVAEEYAKANGIKVSHSIPS